MGGARLWYWTAENISIFKGVSGGELTLICIDWVVGNTCPSGTRWDVRSNAASRGVAGSMCCKSSGVSGVGGAKLPTEAEE